MVVDTSVLAAMLYKEPGWQAFYEALRVKPAVMSAASYLEIRIVMQRDRFDRAAVRDLAILLEGLGIVILAVDEAQARVAADAYAIYGKGRHHAALNFGDCFSYALARHLDQPLLFKGDDFRQTDVRFVTPF